MNTRFSFIGEIDANSLESKVPFYREIKTDKAQGYGLNLVVIAATNNRAFVEMAGFKNEVIKTMDKDNNKIDIDWEDRFSEDSLNKVASYKKSVITLNGERHEFISEYDFIEFIIAHISEIKGKRFTVIGQVKKNIYKGKISDRFQIQNLFEVKEDDEKKNQLKITSEFFFDKDGVDTADWKEEKKIRINGYTKEYIDKDNPGAYVPQQIVFGCEKVDFENETHVNRVKYKLEQINLDYEDGKITSSLKKGKYYSIMAILSYKNGAETIEFSESELTDNQKRAIELGLKTLDDFRPSGSIYGNRIVEYRLTDYVLKEKYADGCIQLEDSASDFEDNIYVAPGVESMDDFEEAMNAPKKETVDDDDIFG